MTSLPELPLTFTGYLQTGQSHYAELQARYTVALEDLAQLAFCRGTLPRNTHNEVVLYTLDGNVTDAGGYDDYAHRLSVTFQPAPRKVAVEDRPSEALTTKVYDTAQASYALAKQAKYGAYITAATLQRAIPLRNLGPQASSFDASNETQLAYQPTGSDETRYAVDPQGGQLESIRPLPYFSSLVNQAYDAVVLHTARLAANRPMMNSYKQAIAEDNANLQSKADNLSLYTQQSRDVQHARPRIRNLIKAIEDSPGELDAALTSQLMIDGIGHVASLALLNSTTYYEKDRAPTSFNRRLQWVAEHAGGFRATLGAFMETQSSTFDAALTHQLAPAQNIVDQAQGMAADIQPPKAIYVEGDFWKLVRAL